MSWKGLFRMKIEMGGGGGGEMVRPMNQCLNLAHIRKYDMSKVTDFHQDLKDLSTGEGVHLDVPGHQLERVAAVTSLLLLSTKLSQDCNATLAN